MYKNHHYHLLVPNIFIFLILFIISKVNYNVYRIRLKGVFLMSNKTVELQNKRKQFVPKGVSNGNLNIAQEAKGATITDIDGKEWIDFASAIGTINVGHNHPKVNEAVKAQIDQFIHPGFNVIMYESYIELAEKLCEITPGDFPKQAALFNSGAEAVENAVKIARKYTKRQAVVTFTRGFH